jgi:hypothetical protein
MIFVYLPVSIFLLVNLEKETGALKYVCGILRALSLELSCIYCLYLFIPNIIFFIHEKEKRHNKNISCFLLILIVYLWLGRLINVISIGIVSTAQYIFNNDPENDKNPTLSFITVAISRTFGYVIDFCTVLTLLYLFYCQGKSAELRAKKRRPINFDQLVKSFGLTSEEENHNSLKSSIKPNKSNKVLNILDKQNTVNELDCASSDV